MEHEATCAKAHGGTVCSCSPDTENMFSAADLLKQAYAKGYVKPQKVYTGDSNGGQAKPKRF